ncbi:MAG: hypothetical protein IKZ91_03805 [Bacteroidales bacterium]|nr:hypothetical protein [Bacteroidales bacterium]
MADKKWNDELRRKMSEYEETPPAGLWEALEASGAAGGAAAGAGLLRRLFGGRTAPVWWSLAGVAAAVAAVLLLRTPGVSVDPSQKILADTESSRSVEDILPSSTAQTVEEDAPSSPAQLTPSFQAPTGNLPAKPARTASVVETPSEEAVEQDASLPASELVPATDEIADAKDGPAKEISPEETPADDAVLATPAEDAPPSFPTQSSPSFPATTGNPSVKRDRPLLAASFVGSGMPGSNASSTAVEYGLNAPAGFKMSSATLRQASLISRNKVTETLVNQKIDYQAGLILSLMITRHLGVETGLQYTRLGSYESSTCGTFATITEESMGYLGLPLRVVYMPIRTHLFSAYLSGGPEIECGVMRVRELYESIGGKVAPVEKINDVPSDIVLSGSLNAGVQLQPFSHGAFFLQPGVVLRYTGEDSPESYYTSHPLSFRLSAGYRIMF